MKNNIPFLLTGSILFFCSISYGQTKATKSSDQYNMAQVAGVVPNQNSYQLAQPAGTIPNPNASQLAQPAGIVIIRIDSIRAVSPVHDRIANRSKLF